MSAGFYRLEPGPELVYTYTYDEMKILVEGDMQISQLKDGKGEELVKEEVDAKKGMCSSSPRARWCAFVPGRAGWRGSVVRGRGTVLEKG